MTANPGLIFYIRTVHKTCEMLIILSTDILKYEPVSYLQMMLVCLSVVWRKALISIIVY